MLTPVTLTILAKEYINHEIQEQILVSGCKAAS